MSPARRPAAPLLAAAAVLSVVISAAGCGAEAVIADALDGVAAPPAAPAGPAVAAPPAASVQRDGGIRQPRGYVPRGGLPGERGVGDGRSDARLLEPLDGVPRYAITLSDLGMGEHVTRPAEPPPPGFPAHFGQAEARAFGWGLRVGYRRVGGPAVGEEKYGGTITGTVGSHGNLTDMFGAGTSIHGDSGSVTVVLRAGMNGVPGRWSSSDGPQPGPGPDVRLWLERDSPLTFKPYLVSNAVTRGNPSGEAPAARPATAEERDRIARLSPPDDPPPGLVPVRPDAAVWPGVPVTVYTGSRWAAGTVASVDREHADEVTVTLTEPVGEGGAFDADAVTVTVPPRNGGGIGRWLAVDPEARLAAADRPDWFNPSAEGFDPDNPAGPRRAAREAEFAARRAKAREDWNRPRKENYPVSIPTPREGERLPDDLALPVGTTVYFQNFFDRWGEMTVQADEDPAEPEYLEVMRPDRASSRAELVFRSQLLVEKTVVRDLRREQRLAEAAGEPIPHVRTPPAPVAAAGGGAAGGTDDPAPTRRLQSYPATIPPPAGAGPVPADLTVPAGTKLSACWAGKWNPVTALRADPGGPIEIRWDAFGSSWDGWVKREDLAIDAGVAAALRAADGSGAAEPDGA